MTTMLINVVVVVFMFRNANPKTAGDATTRSNTPTQAAPRLLRLLLHHIAERWLRL